MRTPDKVQRAIENLDAKYEEDRDALVKELAQSTLGVDVGDTVFKGNQTLVIASIDAKFVRGTLTDTTHEIRTQAINTWTKA